MLVTPMLLSGVGTLETEVTKPLSAGKMEGKQKFVLFTGLLYSLNGCSSDCATNFLCVCMYLYYLSRAALVTLAV